MPQTVHLIRHGQSTFNAATAVTPWIDPMLFDAPLSPRGHEQVAALREQVPRLEVDLVVTSPLTRALQTAVGAFAGTGTPILVEALPRERVDSSCDLGRSPALLSRDFPQLSFDHLDDPWWYTDPAQDKPVVTEPLRLFEARVLAFEDWLAARPERTIAVVGHGSFFHRLSGQSLANAEVHTMRSMGAF